MVFALYFSAFVFVFGQGWDDQVSYVYFLCFLTVFFFFYGFPVSVGIWRRAGCGSTVLSQLPLRHKLSPVGNQACHNAKNNCHQLPSLAVETSPCQKYGAVFINKGTKTRAYGLLFKVLRPSKTQTHLVFKEIFLLCFNKSA